MSKCKNDRIFRLLTLALVVLTVSAMFIGLLVANAAVTSVTIKFGANTYGGDYTTYYDTAKSEATATDKYNSTSGARTDFVVQDKATTGTDPNIFFKFTDGISVQSDYILCVKYAIMSAEYDSGTTGSAAAFFFTGSADEPYKTNQSGSNGCDLGYNYNPGGTMKNCYAVIGYTGTIYGVRLDIPHTVKAGTTATIAIQEIYIGPPSGSPDKYTVTFDTDGGSTITDQSVGYNGKPTNPGTPTKKSTNSKAYTFKHWLNTSTNATLTSAQVASTPITGNTTYKAIYTETNRYAVTYKKYDGTTIKTEYVTHGSKPTSPPADQTMTNTDLVHYEWAGWKKNNTGTAMTAAEVKNQTITAATTFQASFNKSYRVRFRVYNNDRTYKDYSSAYVKYVPEGASISSVFTALPPVNTVYPTGSESTSTERYEKTDSTKVWNRVYVDGSGSMAITEDDVMAQTIGKAIDFEAVYRTKYVIRYYSEGTLLSETDWCYAEAKTFAYNGTLPTSSGKAFVGWVRSTETSADAVNTGTAQVPGTSNITGPTYFHARFLSTSFTGTEYKYHNTRGSETPGIVATRKVECTDATTQDYKITLEVYSYGVADGFFDIWESIDGNFLGKDKVQTINLYYVPYNGNGAWGIATEVGSAGGNGIIYKDLDPSGTNKVYNHSSGAASTGYWNIHWLNNDWAENSLTKADFRSQAGLTEIGQGGIYPYGYKLRVVITCRLDRDSIIGGNNVLISTPEYTSVKYDHDTDASKDKSYPWSQPGQAIKASETTANNDLVNVNVPIQYDFCVHDYYMDLYDVQKKYYTTGNVVTEKTTTEAADDTNVYMGLISILRNASEGEHGLNNRGVYQYLYTHGNEPIFSWEDRGTYADSGKLYYNTDCDGVHNHYVDITYKVDHETMGTVYETRCVAEDITSTDGRKNGSMFYITDSHKEKAVDFTKDHTVTVTATVAPVSGVTDSFGKTKIGTFTTSADSYFFAPRFAVIDYSTTAYTSMQRESEVFDDSFNVTKSAVDGPKASTLSKRSTGAAAPARIYSHMNGNPTLDACDMIYYSFDSGNTFVLHPTSQRMLTGIESATYTTKVINTPKRMDASEVNGTKAKGTILRNFYVIPANVIAFDDRAVSFLPDASGTLQWADIDTYKDYYQTSDVDTRETQGINTSTATNVLYPNNRIHGNSNAASDRTESYYVGQAKYVKVDGSVDAAGERLNQNQYGIFTFTGTGFDIISRTGPNTGVLVAAVYRGELTEAEAKKATPIQNILVDTYLAGKDLYQIPVIKYEAPSHGTYTVYFRAYYHEIFDHNLVKRTTPAALTEQRIAELLGWDASVPATIMLGEFTEGRPATRTDGANSYEVYIDGIRVYNTLGTLTAATGTGNIFSTTENAATYAAYAVYNCGSILHSNGNIEEFVAPEANATFFNVSDFLVDSHKTDWTGSLTGDNGVNGILYIAASMPEDYVDDAGGQNGSSSDSGDGLVHAGFHLGMSGTLYTEVSNGKYYVYRMEDTDGNGTGDTKERVRHNGQDVYYKLENGKTVYYAGTTELTDAEFFAACGQTVCYYDSKYDAIGPEHEIYLAKNSGVAMEIGTADTVHVGLRSMDGTAITVKVWNGTAWVSLCEGLKTGTETYFDATAAVKSAGGKLYLKVTGGNYASIVNVKTVGGTKPSVSRRLIMDAVDLFSIPETPIDDTLVLKHSLNLASDISLNYIVTPDILEGATDSWVTVDVPLYEGNQKVGVKTLTLRPELKNYVSYYTLDGLTAVHMNDTLEAKLHVIRDGVTYVSETDTYSIAAYAYGQLNKESTAPALKTLCAQLLRYGAYAQSFKGYRTDALADSQMTEAHRALLQDLDSVTFGSNNAVLEDLEAPAALWSGKVLDLGSKVAVKFVFCPRDYEGNVEDLTLSVTYTSIDGQEQTLELAGPQLYNEAMGQYAFTFDGLLAAELRSVLYVRVCEDGTPISRTLVYSSDTYGNGKTGTLGDLCKALFAYSDAAKAFFIH